MASTQPHPHTGAAADPVRTNWAGNYTFRAQHVSVPTDLGELRALIPTLGQAKGVGTRHSFNHIADTLGTHIDLSRFKAMSLDAAARTATVGGGVTYGELAPWLHVQGFAVHNLASLPHISVAGACATATHGSGVGNGCLSTAVRALEFINGSGELITLSRETTPQEFRLGAVHLGAVGVITGLTLDLVPAFDVAQTVYENLSFDQLPHDLRAVLGAEYSVSLFTDWQEHRVTQAWVKRKLGASPDAQFPDTFFGGTRQTTKLHPLPNMSAEHCTEQLGVPGPWYERLPHFRLDYTPSAGAELQTEYFVPLERAREAILAVEQLRDRISPHLLISELRAVAADDLPMSMAFGRDSLALHFTWVQEIEPVLTLLPAIEAQLAPFTARPHWAKLFTTAPGELPKLYPEFEAFKAFVQRHDPAGRFRNAYLDEALSA